MSMSIDDCCNVQAQSETSLSRKDVMVIAYSVIALAIGFTSENVLGRVTEAHLVYLSVAAVSGYHIVRNALSLIIHGKFGMDLLMTIATVGAFATGHAEEGASIMLLFFTAEFLEGYAVKRATRSIHALMQLAPDLARLKENDGEREVHVHDVEVGQTIVIRPGDRIPLDGMVISGAATVNESALTEESLPVNREVDGLVYAGTIDEDGYLEVKVTKASENTLLSRIIRLVQEAQEKKSKTENFVERFTGRYTPAVLLITLATAVVPVLFFKQSLDVWIYRALILLVVSCPCALTISTPVSMVSAITSAARNGVLIKSGRAVELVSQTEAIAFDKTGTLTMGRLTVEAIHSTGSASAAEILKFAASLEVKSQHPIARAIVERARGDGMKLADPCDFQENRGKGVSGKIGPEQYFLGTASFLADAAVKIPTEVIEEAQTDSGTHIFLGNRSQVLGAIVVRDNLRTEAPMVVSRLRARRLQTVMISGDTEKTASNIADKLGLDHYHSQLLPEEKVEEIDELTKQYGTVTMVGDGINDAPALARASVGIAMGVAGSDVALESADIALMHDDLSRIDYIFKLSRKTLQVIKENVTASVVVKGSFAVLAILGLVSLWMAVAIGDMGLSLLVILNAMRLALIRPK
jgi:Cd2+/Zn2+-exporting ATPase